MMLYIFVSWLQNLSGRPYLFDIVMCLVSAVPLTQEKGNLVYPSCSPSKSAMTLRSAQIYHLYVSYFMYCSNCFKQSTLSLTPNACATGMEGKTFPLCR